MLASFVPLHVSKIWLSKKMRSFQIVAKNFLFQYRNVLNSSCIETKKKTRGVTCSGGPPFGFLFSSPSLFLFFPSLFLFPRLFFLFPFSFPFFLLFSLFPGTPWNIHPASDPHARGLNNKSNNQDQWVWKKALTPLTTPIYVDVWPSMPISFTALCL